MRRLDFIISNDGHHAAMFEPVVKALSTRSDLSIRIISLCEFRGLVTPARLFDHDRVQVHRILRSRFRRGSTGRQTGNPSSGLAREIARRLSWSLLLKRGILDWVKTRPDLVVLPNDAAFPYQHICRLLADCRTPFLLVQEGIRFPLPNAEGDEYGKNGAVAIAAWGQSSADFFQLQGVPDERIRLTGSPRFDSIWQTDWKAKAEQFKKELNLGRKSLLLLTNPIDDQGFCTTDEKLALVRRFLNELDPLFRDPEFSLVIKLHGRESEQDYRKLRDQIPYDERIQVLREVELYPLFYLARASVVFASTVGLESLLFGCPLGVLEIPGFGFVYDYVSSGAAEGLTWDGHLAERVERLLRPDATRKDRTATYVRRNLSSLGSATERVGELVLQQLELQEARA